ncbi:MAG: DUF2764 family protein [Bacteroidales bacterium]|nr:DUF2764 family protein [Bacteroidales bacterium]
MFKRYYHCFIAGLYDIAFDDGKNLNSLDHFRSELKDILHPDDYKLASLLFMQYDNKNLIRFMAGNSEEHNYQGNFKAEDFEEQIARLDSIIQVDDILPYYMVEVLKDWLAAEKNTDLIEAEKRLTEGYFTLIASSGNRFLRKWSEYELDLNNILVLKSSMDLGIDAAGQIVGENQLAEELRVISRRKSDFRVPPEPDYASLIFNIAGENEFLERELKIDINRWNHINDLTFFEYFTVDFILGYMVKLSIALRWRELDAERGEEMLKRLVSDLKEVENKPLAGQQA